jgi:thiosulfate/3-mercaptopyruvate sulfurtransferase
MDALVSTEWLGQHLADPDLAVVDASWHMPVTGRSGRGEYLETHIPGARFLDIEALSDRSNPLPHMLPTAEQFGQAMAGLGVDRSDRIVVYDNSPLRTAARGWFMLRHFGAERVAILDGGFQAWIVQGRPTESGEPAARQSRFDAQTRSGEVVDKSQVLDSAAGRVVDARSAARFEGSEADPRPGIAAGHVPGACNLPYASLYREDGRFKPASELERLFAEAGVDPGQPFIASCGSGVTANSLIFAAHLLGNRQAQLYDGSWSEWGADPAAPKAVGPA